MRTIYSIYLSVAASAVFLSLHSVVLGTGEFKSRKYRRYGPRFIGPTEFSIAVNWLSDTTIENVIDMMSFIT